MNQSNTSFTGLNPLLLGQFYVMKRDENANWVSDGCEREITAPLTQCHMEIAPNWQSAFENAGIESKFPALAQMLQSGMFGGALVALGEKMKDSKLKEALHDAQKAAEQMVGRTGITKLNSTQVFSGMAPIKIQVTAFFKAHSNPILEVERPIMRLQQWVLPQYLAPDGGFVELLKTGDPLSLMPSLVPKVLGFRYKNRVFQPMVIENISDPLDAPIDRDGNRIHATLQMTLCSLTALDRNDWRGTYTAI